MAQDLSEHKEEKQNSSNLAQCHLCAFRTNATANLSRHIKTQHSEFVKISCPHCGAQVRDDEQNRNLYLDIQRARCDRPGAERKIQRLIVIIVRRLFITKMQ